MGSPSGEYRMLPDGRAEDVKDDPAPTEKTFKVELTEQDVGDIIAWDDISTSEGIGPWNPELIEKLKALLKG